MKRKEMGQANRYQSDQKEGRIIQLKKQSNKTTQAATKLILKGHDAIDIVRIEDILLISADGNYSIVFSKNGKKYTTSKTLKHFENHLSTNKEFIRVHKSHLVNGEYIESISHSHGLKIYMLQKSIPVSRRCKNKLLEYFGLAVV